MKLINPLFTAALLLAATVAHAQTKWDLPAAYPATNFHSVNLQEFANDVDKASGGKLKITCTPTPRSSRRPRSSAPCRAGRRRSARSCCRPTRTNGWCFGADGVPFLADSYDEAFKLWRAQKPVLEKKLAEQGLMVLYAVAWPPQGIYTKKPVATADLKGMKWRAYSPATSRIAELVQAQPVTVQAAELAQALATGVVESTMTSGATGWTASSTNT
jgi:TRAP-type C4-dicarboxylate transport system substrate-binding protein